MKTLIILIFAIIFSLPVFSQNDSVLTVDYAKVTLSPDVIPQLKVQMEVGGTSWYDEDISTFNRGTENEYYIQYFHLLMELPVLAFRVGIDNNVEFRVAGKFMQEFHHINTNSLMYIDLRSGIYSGAPIEAGLKYKFLNESKYLPKAAVSATLFIPAGDYYFHMDKISPLFKLMLQKSISKKFSITANAGYGWNVYDFRTDKYGNFSYSINLQINNKLGAYAEQFSLLRNKYTPDHRIGAGLTYRFAKNVMAVVQGGFGLSDRAPDIFGSGGIGFMFP